MDSNVLLIIGGVVASFISYCWGLRDKRVNHADYEKQMYLWNKGWRNSGYGDYLASDEKWSRPLNEAVERQKELDRVSNLNLPKEALILDTVKTEEQNVSSYQLGGWKSS